MPLRRGVGAHKALDRLFYASIWLKGVHAVFEILGGFALLLTTPASILQIVAAVTQDEMAEDPNDFIANTLLNAVQRISVSSQHFAALYLLSHGIVKVALVIGLLRNKGWAYPAALAVFGAFIIYQIYRFTLTHGLGLIALTVFDLAVMWLIWREYRLREFASRP